MAARAVKQVAGQFDKEENILHLWFPAPVNLVDMASVTTFFDEVVSDWIDVTPGQFYLLVNYANLHIAAAVSSAYGESIKRFHDRLLGTFRYAVSQDFTGVAVSLGNMQLQAPANMFSSESVARAAIRQAAGK